jgi:diguanylate cyclase (GGDEF)-like protein
MLGDIVAPEQPSERGLILVVDDDASTRTLVSRWLQKEGYEVREAPSGEGALEVVATLTTPLDCVVLDVMMPGMNGVEVVQRLRGIPAVADVSVLLLTAHATGDEDVVAGMDAGASDYMFKPFSGPVMVARVRALCRRTQHARELKAKLLEAEEHAAIDPLTNLYNRRQFERTLTEEAARARRHQSPCAILLGDLDYFKTINDTHGHAEGDRVLTYFSAKVQSILRGEDRAFRYGGEEFAVILPGADVEGALRVDRRLREALARDPYVFAKGHSNVINYSAGIACAQGASDFTFKGIVEDADRALYAAKRNGRNRTELA